MSYPDFFVFTAEGLRQCLAASSERPLKVRPQKDGSVTEYACGIMFAGSWATRLEQHEEFCQTGLGKYILELESAIERYQEELAER